MRINRLRNASRPAPHDDVDRRGGSAHEDQQPVQRLKTRPLVMTSIVGAGLHMKTNRLFNSSRPAPHDDIDHGRGSAHEDQQPVQRLKTRPLVMTSIVGAGLRMKIHRLRNASRPAPA